jgi:hypothetical protein
MGVREGLFAFLNRVREEDFVAAACAIPRADLCLDAFYELMRCC